MRRHGTASGAGDLTVFEQGSHGQETGSAIDPVREGWHLVLNYRQCPAPAIPSGSKWKPPEPGISVQTQETYRVWQRRLT